MDSTPRDTSRRESSAECGRPDLIGRLVSGEELSGAFGAELAAHAKGCPSCSMRLSLVQQAERWLADQASSNRGLVREDGPCPSAEELYDFGRGPGAQRLPLSVERRIEAHLVACDECRGLVATLAQRPPAPLFERGVAAASVPAPQPSAAPVLRGRFQRPLLQLAAAAAVVAMAWTAWQLLRTTDAREAPHVARGAIEYPVPPLLRGDSSSALHFPRSRILAASDDGSGGTWHSLRFVIAPQAGAEGYRVELTRAAASAFERRGEPIDVFESVEPEFEWPSPAARTLAAGRYTWEAWAKVHGLEQPLGRRDFEVVVDPAAREALAELGRLPGPERATRTLAWLVEHGYATDARAYARGLPQSAERDAFLAAVPGR